MKKKKIPGEILPLTKETLYEIQYIFFLIFFEKKIDEFNE